MSKTVLCVLLKMLMLTRANILSKYPDSDFIQNYPDNASVRNKVDEIPFENTSVLPESKKVSSLSKPTFPRAFVEFYNKFLNETDNISVTFRWNQPNDSTKIIQGYTVQCWFIENQKKIKICDNKSISAAILEYRMHNVKPNTTYYCKVRAHTKIGAGPYTKLINISTTHENPIPQLLMVTKNGIDIWDQDLKINLIRVEDKNVICATYSIAENTIYWSRRKLGKYGELKMLDINTKNITKITNLTGIVSHLCIDWIAKKLYWMQSSLNNNHEFNYIIMFDLTMWKNGRVKYILKINSFYYSSFTILPFMRTFYWINSTEDEKRQLIKSDLDGNNIQPIQNNLSVICPSSLDILKDHEIKIDMNSIKPLIYWLSRKYLIVTDLNVSMCNWLLHDKKHNFNSLTIDKTNIYFSSSSNIYVLKKKYAHLESVDASNYTEKIEKPHTSDIHAFGKSLQSYPPLRCLRPDKKVYNLEKSTYKVMTNSIIVNFPKPVPKNGCEMYNLPTALYTINIISDCLDNELNKFHNFTVQTYERHYEIKNLTPSTEYKLLLVTSNFYSDHLSMDPLFSPVVMLRTEPSKLDAPENVTVYALTPTIAAVYWMPKIMNCVPVIYEVSWMLINLENSMRPMSEILLINKTKHKKDSKFFTIIEPLIPAQKYRVYVRIYPLNYSELYTDSMSKTLYMYSEPNNITLNEVSINGMNISWIPSVNLTIHYVLEYKNVEMQEWQTAKNFEPNNGEKIMYYIKNLLPGTQYEFRLILRYPKYEKDFIWPSDKSFTFSTLTSDISSTPGILVKQYYLQITLSLVAVVTVICVCYFYYYRQCKKSNEQVLPPTMSDIELETLHEIPNIPNVQLNTLYSPMLEYNSDKYTLTEIKREEIRLEKLLGSGAFGMVYQGKVKNLEGPGTEISAAIKMLPENASSKEKEKFLEEAKLMNHFRHKHVLRLLAVCLDEHSPLIVLELMEIGDLLQYLRETRNLQPSDSHALRLQDLFSMCEDVARGCCYLENLRFVHRDLACRNCLVSARDRENRVVKIGDFGLARDIYKNDCYRVKGQGQFPVRWAAPESLVVGTFTSQSDVWSFGVLMWEITSLGEEPYTGRDNLQVIDYVRAGGRLPMPLNCPPTLYELMLRCWSLANDRPNFNFCLKNIIALRNNTEDTLLSPVDII